MPWHWLAVRSEPPGDTLALGELHTLDGSPAGFLAAWPAASRRPAGALGVDARAIDPTGPPAWISLALAPTGVQLVLLETAPGPGHG